MRLPKPNKAVIAKKPHIVAALRSIVQDENVVEDPEALKPYECDGLSAYRQLPLAVVLPETTDQISEILRYCDAARKNVVPRGAGTS